MSDLNQPAVSLGDFLNTIPSLVPLYTLEFHNEIGEHLKHDLIYRHLKRIFAAMGTPDLRFHDLRHSYAVLSLQSGCDIKTVQENLGHYAAAFTLDTYAHVTQAMRKDGADKLNRLLDELATG